MVSCCDSMISKRCLKVANPPTAFSLEAELLKYFFLYFWDIWLIKSIELWQWNFLGIFWARQSAARMIFPFH